jgi:hypothetical protein
MAKQEIKFQQDIVPASNGGSSLGSSTTTFNEVHMSGDLRMGGSLKNNNGDVILGSDGAVSENLAIAYSIALG